MHILLLFLILIIIIKNNKFKKEYFIINDEKINIILSCDKNQFSGLLATTNSICLHSNIKNKNINFYYLVDKNEKKILENLIKNKFPYKINYKIKEINKDPEISNNIRVNKGHITKCDNIMNFARFNFHKEFPNIDKVLYIDADIIIKDDITKLYKQCNTNISPFYAVNIGTFSNTKDIYDITSYKPDALYFNAGLYITSLNYWRKNNLKIKIIEIMKKHKNSKKGLFNLGTQPILNIIFYNNFKKISKEWNTTGLGCRKVEQKLIKIAKGLHWNGPNKPWKKNGRYQKLWTPYNVLN